MRYDLNALSRAISKEEMARRGGGFWKWREFLPVRHSENVVTLGEVDTPLIKLQHVAPKAGEVLVKDEGRLPTGSFKARGLALAVAMAKELGLKHLAIPTNGNAGAAMAAYGAAGGSATAGPGFQPALRCSATTVV